DVVLPGGTHERMRVLDKPVLTTGRDPLTGRQAVYVAYTRTVPEPKLPGSISRYIVVQGSNNWDDTLTGPTQVHFIEATINSSPLPPPKVEVIGATPAVGPNGELYVTWLDTRSGIWFDRDLDGLWKLDSQFGTDILVRRTNRAVVGYLQDQPGRP